MYGGTLDGGGSHSSGLRVTVYGVDDGAAYATQQTASGPLALFSRDAPPLPEGTLAYLVDTAPGTSGGPIIHIASTIGQDTDETSGIHTYSRTRDDNGLCVRNGGTSLWHPELMAAIQTFPGNNVVYVDSAYTPARRTGAVLTPYATVKEATTAAPGGSIVSIVAGSYNERLTIEGQLRSQPR